METAVRGMPLEYPPKPERLNAYGNGGGWGEGRGGRVSGGHKEWDGDLWDEVGAEGPGEGVTLSLSLFLSLSISDPVSSHSCDSLSGSPGLGTCGPRARGGGEHAELAVTVPDAAADHAPVRVRGPAAGPPAFPGL